METTNFPADRSLNITFSGPMRAFLAVGKLIRILLTRRKLTRLFSADGNLKKPFAADGNLTKLFCGGEKVSMALPQMES